MRRVFSVAACVVASTDAIDTTTGWCVLDGASSINDMMDAGVYSWAASQRCAPQGLKANNVVKCEMDVANAAQSVTGMIDVILRAVKTCGLVNTNECGMAASKLTSHLEGIAAAAGGVVQECPNQIQKQNRLIMRDSLRANGGGMPMNDPSWPEGEHAICVVDMKDTMNELFQVSIMINRAKKGCAKDTKDKRCVYDAFSIISAFAGIGKYLMGAIGHCSSGALAVPDFPLACSEHIAGLTRAVSGFVGDTDNMVAACNGPAPEPVPGYIPDTHRKTEVILIPKAAPAQKLSTTLTRRHVRLQECRMQTSPCWLACPFWQSSVSASALDSDDTTKLCRAVNWSLERPLLVEKNEFVTAMLIIEMTVWTLCLWN